MKYMCQYLLLTLKSCIDEMALPNATDVRFTIFASLNSEACCDSSGTSSERTGNTNKL